MGSEPMWWNVYTGRFDESGKSDQKRLLTKL